MTLTVAEVANQGAFRLGYRDASKLPEQLSIIAACNNAGHALTRARNWRWLHREGQGLSTVANQGYINLPDDFKEILSIEADQTVGGVMAPSSHSSVMQGNTVAGQGSGLGHFYTIVWPTGAISGPTAPPRLEISPVPATATTNAFKMNYLAGFKVVEADSDHIYVPLYMEELYVEFFVAHVGGILQRAKGSLVDRLLALEPLIEMAAHADSTTQRQLGPMSNTAEDQVSNRSFSTITSSGPAVYVPP